MNLETRYKNYAYKKLIEKISKDKGSIFGIEKSLVKRILFMPTNGGGLGHLTRTLAVARRLKQMYPNVEIIFFTTSFALHLIAQEGFLAYSFPSMNYFAKDIKEKEIDNAIENQIMSIVKMHNIDTLVFDGVFPYACLVNAIEKLGSLNTIWIQRGMHKSGKSETILKREKYFNLILVPGEGNLNANLFNNQGKWRHCPPIIYLKKEELLPREAVLSMWNLDPNKKTVFIQLGEGLGYDVNSLIYKVVKQLKNKENLQIVLGESIIAQKRYNFDPNIFIIRDYPNSIYFNAFDFAIINSSYNIFHETIYFGVPSIIFPIKETGTDDHFARASIADKLGTGFVFHDFNEMEFDQAVSQLLNPRINKKMRENSKGLFVNGAQLAAKYIMDSI